MALIQMNIPSKNIQVNTGVNIIMPLRTPEQIEAGYKHPVLWLLHGARGDHTDWLRKSSVERYARRYGLAVIMPDGSVSSYMDLACGLKYLTYISDELMSFCYDYFPISDNRDDNFIAGACMGGSGAIRIALTHPEKYSAAASISGTLGQIKHEWFNDPRAQIFNITAFGTTDIFDVLGTNNDIFYITRETSYGIITPKIFQCCGTEDMLYADNIVCRDFISSLSYDYTFTDDPGAHTWEYYDRMILEVIKWLPVKQWQAK